MRFKEWLINFTEEVSYDYDRQTFSQLPWRWREMYKLGIVQPLYYYAKENYINGQPERLEDNEFSLITLKNKQSIPSNELSAKNFHSGKTPNLTAFYQMLKTPQSWYDNKIDQVYDSIAMLGKHPEELGGKDIRNVR